MATEYEKFRKKFDSGIMFPRIKREFENEENDEIQQYSNKEILNRHLIEHEYNNRINLTLR